MIADLYTLPVGDEWLLYSPLRRLVARVNAATIAALRVEQEPGGALSELMALLRSDPVVPPEPSRQLDETILPERIVIFPTHRCNLCCLYCDFGMRSQPQTGLAPELAERFADQVLNQLQRAGKTHLTVHLFGGEPLIEEAFIYRFVPYLRRLGEQTGITTHLEASTNGHLSHTMAEFAANNIDTLVVSFDGPDYQNLHRPASGGAPSLEPVVDTIHRLGRGTCQLCLRTCVTHESVKKLPELARWICSTFKPDSLDFEPLTENAYSRAAGLRPPDPLEFARAFMQARVESLSHGVPATNGLAVLDNLGWSSCPMGRDTLMLMPDGTITVCYLPPDQWRPYGVDTVAGNMTDTGLLNLSPDTLLAARLLLHNKPRCAHCFCRWTCAGGCHARQTPPGCAVDYDATCLQTRLITAALLLERTGADPFKSLLNEPSSARRLANRKNDFLQASADNSLPKEA